MADKVGELYKSSEFFFSSSPIIVWGSDVQMNLKEENTMDGKKQGEWMEQT